MSKPFNEQATVLIADALDLIKRVLVKHSAAVLEEMRDQIMTRNARISVLERDYEEILKESRERREMLEKNAKANDELYNATQRELETARTIAHRAEHRANQAESERDALIGDKDEYCEVLRVLGMDEEGSAVTEILRLMAVEREHLLWSEAGVLKCSAAPYINRCPHEWYQGRCIHCDVAAKDGKPSP